MTFPSAAFREVHDRLERDRLNRSIRALELDLGLRPWDDRDETEARGRLLAQVRYMTHEDVKAFVAAERQRLTGRSA